MGNEAKSLLKISASDGSRSFNGVTEIVFPAASLTIQGRKALISATGPQGATGASGPAGAAGTNGTNGTNGINGATWTNGAGAPSNSAGVDGDYYFNTTTSDVYKKASGAYSIIANIKGAPGAQGIQGLTGATGATGATGEQGVQGATGAAGTNGTNGTPGSVWRTGAGAPSNTLGLDNDFYLNTTTSDVYQRANGSYSIVANIRGAAGAQGVQGATGATGAQGATGAPGAPGSTGSASMSVLSGNVALTNAGGVFQDTGLSISLPSAGTYILFANVESVLGFSGATAAFLKGKLYNSTLGVDVAGSEILLNYSETVTQSFFNTVSEAVVVTVAASSVINLYAARVSTGTFATSVVVSDTNGKTRLSYLKVN